MEGLFICLCSAGTESSIPGWMGHRPQESPAGGHHSLWSPHIQPTGAKDGCRLRGYLWQALNTFMFSCLRGVRTYKQVLRSRYAHSRESPCGSSSGSRGGTRGAGWVLCFSVLMRRTLMTQVWLVTKLYCALFMHDDHSIINRVHPESVPISGNGVAQNYPHPQRAYLLPTRLQAGHDIEEDEPARAVQSP